MKRKLLFILLAFPHILSFSQNALFLPFGQSNQEIEDYLHTRDYIQEIIKVDEDQIINKVSDNRKLVYHFQEDEHYATEDYLILSEKEKVDHAIKSCLDYMKDGNRQAKLLSSKKSQKHYLIFKTDEVIELMLMKDARNDDYIICLKVSSRLYGPPFEVEKMKLASKF